MRRPSGSKKPRGGCAPSSDSNDIFMAEEDLAGVVRAAPLNALKVEGVRGQRHGSGQMASVAFTLKSRKRNNARWRRGRESDSGRKACYTCPE